MAWSLEHCQAAVRKVNNAFRLGKSTQSVAARSQRSVGMLPVALTIVAVGASLASQRRVNSRAQLLALA
jgi:hypothetical protein